jgi:hypothetical protein
MLAYHAKVLTVTQNPYPGFKDCGKYEHILCVGMLQWCQCQLAYLVVGASAIPLHTQTAREEAADCFQTFLYQLSVSP